MMAVVEWFGSAGLTMLMAISSALIVLLAFHVARGGREPSKRDDQDDRVAKIEQTLEAMNGEIAQWRTVLSRLSNRQGQLEQRQDSIDLRDRAEQPYRTAIKLARRGARAAELADTCGLTRGEAELLSLLHQDGPARDRNAPQPAKAKPAGSATRVRKIA